jgi:hypothetical protein
MEHYEQDIFGLTYQFVFITGGLVTVFLALWDVIWP